MNNIFKWIDRAEFQKGKHTPRWERYECNVGKDGNVADHQRITAKMIQKYGQHDVNSGDITKDELLQLRVVGLVHDFAEYIDGDVTGDEKSEKVCKITESRSWDIISQKIIKDTSLLAIAQEYNTIDTDTSHHLYSYFKLYEQMGYICGAILANNLNDPDHTWVHWLCHNVLGNTIDTLHQSQLSSVQHFLADHHNDILKLFSLWEKHNDPSDERNEKFVKAQAIYSK